MDTVYRRPRGALRSRPAAGTLRESALERLRHAIVTGEIAPSERLVEVDLAERLGVSRVPVREALRSLQAEGMVRIEPNRGAFCQPLEAKDLADLYALRGALEELAVRSAAAQFVDLRQFAADRREPARRAGAQRDLPRLIALDSEFHATLALRSGNAHLAYALDACWSKIMRGMYAFFTAERYPTNVWPEHEAIAAAVARGDGDGAAALLREHVDRSRYVILENLRGNHR